MCWSGGITNIAGPDQTAATDVIWVCYMIRCSIKKQSYKSDLGLHYLLKCVLIFTISTALFLI